MPHSPTTTQEQRPHLIHREHTWQFLGGGCCTAAGCVKVGQPCHTYPIFPPRPPEESLSFPSPCPLSWWGPHCSDQTQWHLPLICGDGGSASITPGEISYGPMPDGPVPWVMLSPPHPHTQDKSLPESHPALSASSPCSRPGSISAD